MKNEKTVDLKFNYVLEHFINTVKLNIHGRIYQLSKDQNEFIGNLISSIQYSIGRFSNDDDHWVKQLEMARKTFEKYEYDYEEEPIPIEMLIGTTIEKLIQCIIKSSNMSLNQYDVYSLLESVNYLSQRIVE